MSAPLTPDIYDEVFKGAFVVRTGPWSAVVSELDAAGWKVTEPSKAARTLHLARDGGHDLCLLWFGPEIQRDAETFAAHVAHECHHAAWFTLSERGVSAEAFADETGAYYVGWLAAQVVARLRAPKKGKKR